MTTIFALVGIALTLNLVTLFTSSQLAPKSLDPLANYFEQEDIIVNIDAIKEIEDLTPKKKCDKFKCFNVLHCEINQAKQLSYFVYPPISFYDSDKNLLYSTRSMISREYWQILHTILSSSRATSDPNRACLFVPSVDLTWLDRTNSSLIRKLYENLPYWRFVDGKPGTNHLTISLDPFQNMNSLSSAISRSLLVGVNYDTWTLRPEFDLNIPFVDSLDDGTSKNDRETQWKLIMTQLSSLDETQRKSLKRLEESMRGELLVLGHECSVQRAVSDVVEYLRCANDRDDILARVDKTACRCSEDKVLDFSFPSVLSSAQYCLILHLKGTHPFGDSNTYLISQAIKHGCVPIITRDFVLPLKSSLKWNKISFSLTNEHDLESLATLISSIKPTTYEQMRSEARETWLNHFKFASQVANDIMLHYDGLMYPEILKQ